MVTEALHSLQAVAPALAFLLAGVILAELLDELGFFDAVAARLEDRYHQVPVLALWLLAAATTVVLNLDTTVVLLTPLYVRLARRADGDPRSLALVPLLLAAFASSVLPVSNLTTLIVADRLDLGVAEVVRNLLVPSAAAVGVGWWGYRRRHPTVLHLRPAQAAPASAAAAPPGALRFGGGVVAFLLVAFTVGPSFGVAPWMAALAADVVLAGATRRLPWRSLPLGTAAGVAVLAACVGAFVDPDLLSGVVGSTGAVAAGGAVVLGAVAANLVNNIPATLVAVEGAHGAAPGLWGWLIGANVGSVLVPTGALANVLWRRLVADEGLPVQPGRYVREVVGIAVPALVAAAVVHAGATALAVCTPSPFL